MSTDNRGRSNTVRLIAVPPPTIRLWVTEDLAASQDLLPFIAKAVEWYGMDLTESSLVQTKVVCVRMKACQPAILILSRSVYAG